MNNIWIGFIFIFLDFNLDINASRIGLIPDFVGYILMLRGLAEMAQESPRFEQARPYAVGMTIYTAMLYALDLFGFSFAGGGYLAYLLGLASTAISLFISYLIVMGVRDIENQTGRSLRSEPLYSAWKVMAVLSAALYILILIPVLGILCLILGFIIYIFFLYSFNQSKNLYYQRPLGAGV
ncbi:MAG: hypothetical protein GX549_01420 [Clostridiales bacterium]|nr:hypothetical protein [Clostridiales bacterium]